MYTVNEYADTLLAQRISMVSGVSRVQVLRRAEVRRARAGGSRQTRRPRHRHRRSAARHRREQHQSSHRTPGWRQAGVHHRIQRPAEQRRRLPADHRGLAQRHRRCGWKQLGNVIDSVDNNKVVAWYNNKRAVILAIQRQPGTNTVEVVDSVKRAAAAVPQARFRRRSISRSPSTRRNRSAARFTTWSSRCC